MQTQTVIALQTWSEAFESHVKAEQENRHTQDLMLQHVRVFGLWYAETFSHPLNPAVLTNYDFRQYRKYSLDVEKVKAATWNSRLWALSALCKWSGVEYALEGIKQKSAGRASTKHRSLMNDEYHRLIHALEVAPHKTLTANAKQTAIRDWAMVTLMLNGLRVEEVHLLDWDDLTIKERSGSVIVRNGKGSKERTVALNENTRSAMRSWNEYRGITSTTALFWTAKSGRISIGRIQQTVNELGTQINADDMTCHWLRYTFAKRLEQAGVALETIRDLLGHDHIETTRRYLRSSLAELQSAVDAAV